MYCSMGSVTLEDCIAELGAENAAGVGARSATIARADRVADGAGAGLAGTAGQGQP